MKETVRCRCGKPFDVYRQHRRARLDEGVDVAIRVGDHEMDIQRDAGHAPDRPHDQRADGDVRHEMPVHHVHVNEVGAASLGGGDRLAQQGEVGGQERRGDEDAHRLTSMEMASPALIWKPAAGDCRSTMPGGTPG